MNKLVNECKAILVGKRLLFSCQQSHWDNGHKANDDEVLDKFKYRGISIILNLILDPTLKHHYIAHCTTYRNQYTF